MSIRRADYMYAGVRKKLHRASEPPQASAKQPPLAGPAPNEYAGQRETNARDQREKQLSLVSGNQVPRTSAKEKLRASAQ